MRFSVWLSVILVVFTLATGCRSSKQLTQWATEQESSGNYIEALNLYYEAFQKKQENRAAKKGILRTAQTLLDDHIREAETYAATGDYTNAYDQLQKAERFIVRVNAMGIMVDWPKKSDDFKENIRNGYAKQLYLGVAKDLDTRNYGAAQLKLNVLEAEFPQYSGLDVLRKALKAGPVYDKAIDAIKYENYLDAYNYLKNVESIQPGFRESKKLLTEIENNQGLYMAIFPFTNQSEITNAESVLQAKIMNLIIVEKNPLFSLLNIESLQKKIEAHKSDSSKTSETAITTQLGGNTILYGKLVSVGFEEKPEKRDNKTAYLKETVIRVNPMNGVRYSEDQFKEVTYQDITVDKSVKVQFEFQVVSAIDGGVIYEGKIQKSAINQVKFATYDGKSSDLYPSLSFYESELKKWRAKFNAQSDIKSNDELFIILLDQLAKQTVEEIKQNVLN